LNLTDIVKSAWERVRMLSGTINIVSIPELFIAVHNTWGR
jgi:hypothetical protein